tara:strand:- start:156 stop:392 length:237 start_codon:yes stop_codon:yes gene_type:complete
MEWNKDLNMAPVNTDLEFCAPSGDTYQGTASRGYHDQDLYVKALSLDSHGCGCCSIDNKKPIAWRHKADAPAWLREGE